MSARTRRMLTVSWSAFFVLSLVLQYFAFAIASPVAAQVGNNLFELDGNAVDNSGAALPDDWDKVRAGTSAADDTRFITDGFGAGDDIFTGGNTKDDHNLSSWLWKVGSVQDKDDIENAFAAAYTAGGNTYAYFGLDRYQTSGDATAGFWFFKNAIAKTGDGSGNGSPFSGVHAEGDILVVLDFSNGGATASAVVYKWHNGALTNTNVTGGKCDATPNSQDVCAISNTADAGSPWPYTPKSGTNNVFPANALFEGGLNLTALGLDTGCFSTFLAETRSSNTTSSTLSDFALGQFSFCAPPTIATQVNHDGSSLGENGHITIGQSVTDTANLSGSKGEVKGSVEFFTCFNASSVPDCSTGGTSRGTKTLSGGSATSDAFTPTAAGNYCFRVDYTPAAGSHYFADTHTNSTSECFVVDKKQPTITTAETETVSVGAAISDSATLAGATSDAGGSIIFRAYGPGDGNCSNTAAFVSASFPVSGNDTYGPASFTPDTAGNYRWIASYSGDAKNASVVGKCNDAGETDTVNKVTPTIATQASASVVVGGSITDTATVSGGHSPTGTVTFKLYGPDDATCATAIFTSANRPLSGGSATSAPFPTTDAGTYRWIATYNGDANNESVHGACNDANESVVVSKASPTIATSLVGGGKSGASITVLLGTSVHDTSTLTGATADAGGTVHYQVFSDPQCTTKVDDAGTVAVVAGVPGDSLSVPFPIAGTFYWQADYSGDANNQSATSACNLETVTVAANIPTLTTTASATVVVGGNISDTAHLAGGFNPTGTITFNLYGPDDATCTGVTAFSVTVPVSGNGDYQSGDFLTANPGTYRWTASYSGDVDNAPVAGGCNDANENVLVTQPALHAEKLVSVNDGEFVHSAAAQPGDTLTYHITITNSGTGDAANVPVSDDISALLAHATYNDDASDGGVLNGSTLEWTIPSIAGNGGSVTLSFSVDLAAEFPAGSTDLPNTVVVTGNGSNCEAASEDADCTTTTTVEVPTLGLVKTNDAPIETIDLGNGQTADLPTAKEGATVTYTLKYTTNGVAQTNGVLTDVLPAGLTYVAKSATDSGEFTFVSATKNADGTTTLEWDAVSVTTGGTLTYRATVDTGAAELAQPLENLATIQTDQEGPVSDTSDVFVQAPPQELTPPPTDTFSQPTTPSNPGFALMLILIGLAGLSLAIGFVTPVPERVRRRDRLG
jgi:uncharacterized repeat protein (TIGR01451 family)